MKRSRKSPRGLPHLKWSISHVDLIQVVLDTDCSSNLLTQRCRQLSSMQSITTLHLRNTQRTIGNFPTSLSMLTFLSDIDLSYNELTRVPEALYQLTTLERLNLSFNEIDELSMLVGEIFLDSGFFHYYDFIVDV